MNVWRHDEHQTFVRAGWCEAAAENHRDRSGGMEDL